MAKKKLTSFDFDDELKSKLQKFKFKTVEDVFSQSFLQLMTTLSLSASETQALIHELCISCLPQMSRAMDLLEKEFDNAICFGDSKLDKILHGCIKEGTLTELTGPSGVGKTQMCLHLSLKCLQRKSNQNGVCFIDTEGAFRSERLLELLQCQKCENIEEILSKFHIFQPKTIVSMTEILSSLEIFCIENEIGLVIIDSMASLLRKEFSHNMKLGQASALASWSAQIKNLADQLKIAAIVTNQVTTNVAVLETSKVDERGSESANKDGIYIQLNVEPEPRQILESKGFFICPALGKMWTHFINTRFILQFSETDERQLIVAKSPIAPIVVKIFRIQSNGIQFEEGMSYTFTGMDPNYHRIKTNSSVI